MKIKLLLAGGVVAAFCFANSAAQASTNLVKNGDFNGGSFSHWFMTGGPVTDGQPDRIINYTQPGNVYGESVPKDPYTKSDFGAYFSSDAPSRHGAGIQQDFTVSHSGEYDISFDYYIPTNGIYNPYDADLSVSDRSGHLTTLNADKLGNQGWVVFSVDEFLKKGKNDLNFTLTVPQNYHGGRDSDVYAADFIVTNVDVSGVPCASGAPEPATWAMMLTGFFGMGAVLRGRKKLVATIA